MDNIYRKFCSGVRKHVEQPFFQMGSTKRRFSKALWRKILNSFSKFTSAARHSGDFLHKQKTYLGKIDAASGEKSLRRLSIKGFKSGVFAVKTCIYSLLLQSKGVKIANVDAFTTERRRYRRCCRRFYYRKRRYRRCRRRSYYRKAPLSTTPSVSSFYLFFSVAMCARHCPPGAHIPALVNRSKIRLMPL